MSNLSIEISPQTLQQWQQNNTPHQILDVREPHEFEFVNIGSLNIPLATLPEHIENLDRNMCWVTLCHHGRRSYMAAQFLREHGFDHVYSLTGGIDRWALEIAPHLQRY